MNFKVNLITSGGGKRELDLPATSVQDAINKTKETYSGCIIKSVDLIPSKINNIRIYDRGEQTECDRSLIYHPFGPDA